ncbi:MAG: AsmA family protein [Luteimonas sp.]
MPTREPAAKPRDIRTPIRALRRHPWLTAFGLLLLAIVVLVAIWDWNWFKGPIERQVEARTGRNFDIGGDLDVDLGRTTIIRADQLRFGNADWSGTPEMASADRVELGIRVWPLLQHHVLIPDIRLTKPQLRLEKNGKGVGNWNFLPDSKGNDWDPEFRRLWISGGRLLFLDPGTKTDIDVAVESSKPGKDKPQATAPIEVKGGGHWKGNRFTLHGRAESPLELRDTDSPYRIDAHAQAGATRAHARGTLLDPLRLRDFNLALALSGKNLEDLYPLIGVALPPTPPYALDGRFTRDRKGKLTTWHYQDFKGKVGDSDLAGTASVATGGARPFLRANLVSRSLDFDDLAGFIGGAPDAGKGESTNPELAALAAQRAADPKLLPDTPFNLGKLRAMDADVRLKAHRIKAPKLPLDDMDAHLLLDGGLLKLEPLNFGVAGGDIRSTIRMDARKSPIHTRADIAARGLNLGAMLPKVELAKDAIGKIGGDIKLSGNGNSIAGMLGSSDGTALVGMGRGQISNLVMELAGIDIAESLKFLVKGDRNVPIRCAFGDFGVKGGVMTANALAFDTTDTILIGEGSINLKDETLQLKLRPRPKDRSLLALRSPLIVEGTFKDPDFHPDYVRVGLRGAIALILGSVAPPAALLATLELGPGKDANCGGHYAK